MKERIRNLSLICLLLGLLAACTGTQKKIETDTNPPAVPTGLSFVAGNSQVSLSWTANSETDFKQFNLYQGTSSSNLAKVSSLTTTSTTLTGLTNGQTYFFALDAEDDAGNLSAKTTPVNATPQAATIDTTAPTLLSTSPADGDTNIALNINLSFVFSEAMNQAVTQSALSFNPETSCDFSWNTAGDTLTCNPQSDLSSGASYTVSLSTAAQDLAGNNLATGSSLSFTTGTTTLATCTFGSANFNACLFGN